MWPKNETHDPAQILIDLFIAQSYNPRKAELFLRRALAIREKFKESPTADYKLKNNFLSTVSTSLITDRDNNNNTILSSERSNEASSIENFSSNTKLTLNELSKPKALKHARDEEQNNTAEILFDLGCLLATYDSRISKEEALDFIRRALDIKVLLLGPEHSDCIIINKKLNEAILENTVSLSRAASRTG